MSKRNHRNHNQYSKGEQYEYLIKVFRSEYIAWQNMKQRCYNKYRPGYEWYGARGIIVCDRWKNSFQFFLEDMGPKPFGLTLERNDNDGNYEPNNCKWATQSEQRDNRRCVRNSMGQWESTI
jgi:hypothetical protein